MDNVNKELVKSILPENYETLKSNIVSNLKFISGVVDIIAEEREACTVSQILSWEQSHALTLPEDLKDFYLVSDGFQVTWSYCPAERGRVEASGRLGVRRLGEVRRVAGLVVEGGATAAASSFDPRPTDPDFSEGPVLELDPGLVLHLARGASLWFVDPALDWHFIAPSFPLFLRSMILYQGLPHWMYAFTWYGLPACTEGLLPTFAPYLLGVNRPQSLRAFLEPSSSNSEGSAEEESDEEVEEETNDG